MGTNAQALLNTFATVATALCGGARIDSDHVMSSIFSFGFKDVEKRAPGGVHDAFRQVMVFDHPRDLQVLNRNAMISFGVRFGGLEMEIAALPSDLEMGLGCVPSCFATSVAALFAPAQGPLLAPECLLRGAKIAWVFYRVAKRVGQEHLESNVKANIRVSTRRGKVCRLGSGFTDNEGIPMSIGP